MSPTNVSHAVDRAIARAAVAAREILQEEGTPTRVVSAPCLEWFAQQDAAYRDQVLPAGTAKVAVEAGIALGWREIVGDAGEIVSLDHYGASAAGSALFEEYGFTGQNVAERARAPVGYTWEADRAADVPAPAGLETMLSLAGELGKGFACARIDFYEVDGNVYFGEITFTDADGLSDFAPSRYDRVFGDRIVLPEKKSFKGVML